MWTGKNRAKYNRDHLRYPSDLTDEEWAHIEPLIPPAKSGGGKRRTNMRAVMDGVMYILSTGCQWRYIPKDFPPRSTLHDYFTWWNCDGTLIAFIMHCTSDAAKSGTRGQPYGLHHRQPEREKRGKRGAFIDTHGFDAGKLIKGKKRHILVDMQGLLLHAIIHSAGIQDRDGGISLLATLFGQFPFLKKMFADSAYAGCIFDTALTNILPNLKTEIVKRSDQAKGFVPLPKRWIVERTIAWLNRCRRLAKDWENLNRNALAFLKLASIRFMLRKLCNP